MNCCLCDQKIDQTKKHLTFDQKGIPGLKKHGTAHFECFIEYIKLVQKK